MKIKTGLVGLMVVAGFNLMILPSYGFGLLGPITPWMQQTNDALRPGDIGGPMELGAEYRWNVPTLTYGFDQSFLDYFGTNGVRAVEDAFQILNELPKAADLNPTNYPLYSGHFNPSAAAGGLVDLKSQTLSLILEQMGLAQPLRTIYVIKFPTNQVVNMVDLISYQSTFQNGTYYVNWFPWMEDANNPLFGVIQNRNYDPVSCIPSYSINGVLWALQLIVSTNQTTLVPFSVDPLAPMNHPVAEQFNLYAGIFYTGLSCDDVGGLRYLLSPDNVNYEVPLSDVRFYKPFGKRSQGWRGYHKAVFGAWRPGVGQIRFVRQGYDEQTHRFFPMIFEFVDSFYQNGVLQNQMALRNLPQPDILFAATNNFHNGDLSLVTRTGTTNWINNAKANNSSSGEGPGSIQPPIKISFHKLGAEIVSYDDGRPTIVSDAGWGSFGDGADSTVTYPASSATDICPLEIEFSYRDNSFQMNYTNLSWKLAIPIGHQAALQASTNQMQWTTITTVTNLGRVIQWMNIGDYDVSKGFRVIAAE